MSVQLAPDRREWNTFIERQQGPVFAKWEWGTLSEAYGHERIYLEYTDGGETLGCLPLIYFDSPLFGSKLVSVPFAEYGGPMTSARDTSVSRALQKRAIAIADEREVDYLLLRGIDTDRLLDLFVTEQQYVTFELSLHPGAESTWESFEGRLRRGVRKAQKNDVKTTTATTQQELHQYYDLFLETMRGHGTPPHSFEFFNHIWSVFVDNGDAEIYLAKKDGNYLNGAVVFYGPERAHYWSGVSDYEYRELNGGSLILWEAIRGAAGEGYETFDLGRTREGSGVYMYKKGFGGRKVSLTDAYYFPGEVQKAPDPEDDKYARARYIWEHLPLVVTKYVGPSIRKHFP